MRPRLQALVLLGRRVVIYLVIGTVVGLACWPLNQVDRLQDLLVGRLPTFTGEGWNQTSLLLALLPLVVMPVLLWLRSTGFQDGAGSGITQVMACLEDPQDAPRLMGIGSTVRRFLLWSGASLALFPLGREGPLVQLGAAVAQAFHRLQPRLMRGIDPRTVMVAAAGAGLAGGFNTPLMGVLFTAEELTRTFQARLIWPALLMSGAAAVVSDLGGQPMFGLTSISVGTAEHQQVLWAILVGIGAGLLGAGFARLVLLLTRTLVLPVRRRPVQLGLLLGLGLVLLTLLSGGASAGDGETLLKLILTLPAGPEAGLEGLVVLLSRMVGPVLALSAGIPGGLIDPAFAVGGVFGSGLLSALGGDPALGVALGMAAGLAGATQLPVMTTAFSIRMVGDQSLMPGLLTAAIVGSCIGRATMGMPVYHALASIALETAEAQGRSPSQGQSAPRR